MPRPLRSPPRFREPLPPSGRWRSSRSGVRGRECDYWALPGVISCKGRGAARRVGRRSRVRRDANGAAQADSCAAGAIDADYQAALRLLPDSRAKSDGIAVGEQAAVAVFEIVCQRSVRSAEHVSPPHNRRRYVPTASPAVPHWGQRRPWVMTSGDKFAPSAARLDERCVEAGLR